MNNQRLSSSVLKVRIAEHIQELAEATDAARVSEEMLQYLDMCARFHRYSPQNVWLILMECPHATMVAGFKKWQTMGRFVRKKEKGIPILAPVLCRVIMAILPSERSSFVNPSHAVRPIILCELSKFGSGI